MTNPGRPWLAYDARVFRDLAGLIARVDDYYDVAPGAWRDHASLSPCMSDFLDTQGVVAKHAEMRANSASRASFRKRFFQWLDAFRALKFIHFATRQAYPRQPLEQACLSLMEWHGLGGALPATACAESLLDYFRNRDRALHTVQGSLLQRVKAIVEPTVLDS